MPGEQWRTCRTYEELLSDEFTVGKTLAHGFGPDAHTPDYTYLKGDITKAYSAKVKEVKRSFVFFNLKDEKVPAALIVFDRVVSSNPSFKKYWLLHSIEEPEIFNGYFTVRRTLDGDSGKLHCDVLLPEAGNASVTKVGGEGYEYFVFGKTYPAVQKNPDDEKEHGVWRVEISPEKEAAEDLFLNVMQLTDGGRKLKNAKRIDAPGLVGTAVADRAVTFSRDGALMEGANFSLPKGREIYKVLATDLKPGSYEVSTAAGKQTLSASEDECALWFECPPGTVNIKRL